MGCGQDSYLNKRYLILGATGTLGRTMTQILQHRSDTTSVLCLSRDELKQVEFNADFPSSKVRTVIGDIRDLESIEPYFKNIDVVFHFAALKRIPEMERHPLESIKTNLMGTLNVLKACEKHKVKNLVFSSTDKACRPINTYGACKFLSEQLLFAHQGDVNISVYRWGNVLGSRGSAFLDFKEAVANGQPIRLTDENMSRFWIKIDDAVQFILETYTTKSHAPKVPTMKACSIKAMGEAIFKNAGRTPEFIVTGIRPGEKLHEDIIYIKKDCETVNSKNAPQMSSEEIEELIR